MALTRWVTLVLLLGTAQAQSGNSGDDEPSISCFSDISTSSNSMTCQGEEDVESLKLCYFRVPGKPKTCIMKNRTGNVFTFSNLTVLVKYNLTSHFRGGAKGQEQLRLEKIVKPKDPWVVNATYLLKSDRAVILIGTPYKNDYLSKNLEFNLHILSSEGHLLAPRNQLHQTYIIDEEYLQKNVHYHVKVRAKPTGTYFEGYWSDWSPTLTFNTYDPEAVEVGYRRVLVYVLSLASAVVLLITLTAVLFWRKRIQSIIWPSIPNPKHTLVHLYHPSKGPPVSFNPEIFYDLTVHLVPEASHAPTLPEARDPGLTPGSSGLQSATDSSSSSGASEATLLSSEAEEECPQAGSRASSVGTWVLGSGSDTMKTEGCDGDSDPENVGVKEQGKEEAYVTMSSFYQVK